jgi:cytochrome c biogenesis protein ResB
MRENTVIVEKLGSVKFAVGVVVIIATACIVGTVWPRLSVFQSWWFIALTCVLSASVAVCTGRRFSTMRRTNGYARGRAFGSMLTHISFLLILAGAVVRGVWGEKGFIEIREGQTVTQYLTDREAKPLPFTIHLAKFEIETYEQKQSDQLFVSLAEKNLKTVLPVIRDVEQKFGDFTIKILKYVPDFAVDMQTREVSSRSNQPHNPAILVAVNGPTYQNHRWVFAKFPDFNHSPGNASPLQMAYATKLGEAAFKSFKSTLHFPDGERTLGVNHPLSYGGYTFYQSGYNPNDPSYTSLQVVKDPGVPVVYAGFSLMIMGLFIVFYLNPWLNQRRKQA